MSLEKLNKHLDSEKALVNIIDNYIIKIDYFDQKGKIKSKSNIPLMHIFDQKSIVTKIS